MYCLCHCTAMGHEIMFVVFVLLCSVFLFSFVYQHSALQYHKIITGTGTTVSYVLPWGVMFVVIVPLCSVFVFLRVPAFGTNIKLLPEQVLQ